jgi:hypothetical protein
MPERRVPSPGEGLPLSWGGCLFVVVIGLLVAVIWYLVSPAKAYAQTAAELHQIAAAKIEQRRECVLAGVLAEMTGEANRGRLFLFYTLPCDIDPDWLKCQLERRGYVVTVFPNRWLVDWFQVEEPIQRVARSIVDSMETAVHSAKRKALHETEWLRYAEQPEEAISIAVKHMEQRSYRVRVEGKRAKLSW